MHVHHVHLYVDDAGKWRKWFEQRLAFVHVASLTTGHTRSEWLRNGAILILVSSALNETSPVAHYLRQNTPGVADVAFRVDALSHTLERALHAGARLLQPPTLSYPLGKPVITAQIQGWENLRHTLVEEVADGSHPDGQPSDSASSFSGDGAPANGGSPTPANSSHFTAIDHVVLNVNQGDLERAVSWYERILGFQRQQTFAIQTERSGLSSQVLIHPSGTAQLPINEPSTPGSQIQEFLTWHRGAGIQHLALRTPHLVATVAHLRQCHLKFLPIPPAYYHHLRQRAGNRLTAGEMEAIAAQGILVDWPDRPMESRLLQIFTEPIFDEPTFFVELIERQAPLATAGTQVIQGFGEGNFQALFEAMEQQQLQRGSL